jgi:formamidopyrimidine-DNA glycosylase
MPELPESVVLAAQMQRKLRDKVVRTVEIYQPKCCNKPAEDYARFLPGSAIESAAPFGKWIEVDFFGGTRLMLSLGMGGEIRFLAEGSKPPDKTRFLLSFEDGTGFYITLWWFGYVHLVLPGEAHSMTVEFGPDPLDLTLENFKALLQGRRGAVKPFLLDQRKIRGIGNFYIQEILYRAKLHPLRPINSLSEHDQEALYNAIRYVFDESITLKSSNYELDFYGRRGGYGLDNMAIAYKEGAICPDCASEVRKIKSGSTSQYICPKCQVNSAV